MPPQFSAGFVPASSSKANTMTTLTHPSAIDRIASEALKHDAASVSISEIPSTPQDENLPDVPQTDIAQTQAVQTVPNGTPDLDLTATHIKSSPYGDPVNFLSLLDLTEPVRLLAFALTQFNAVRTDYATAPYLESFNFPTVFATLRDLCKQSGIHWQRQEFYLVIFRSQLLPNANRIRLGELDKNSHEEACASGGLLHYWFGSPNGENRNLATCIWRNRQDAAAGGRGPWHRKARGAAREMYETISFHTHRLIVEEGAESWSMAEYRD